MGNFSLWGRGQVIICWGRTEHIFRGKDKRECKLCGQVHTHTHIFADSETGREMSAASGQNRELKLAQISDCLLFCALGMNSVGM